MYLWFHVKTWLSELGQPDNNDPETPDDQSVGNFEEINPEDSVLNIHLLFKSNPFSKALSVIMYFINIFRVN